MDLWDFFQQSQINEHGRRIVQARSETDDARRELERKLDKLSLINMAMWSILEERLGVTEKDLGDRMRELDLRDGKLDGRAATQGRVCPSCQRMMSLRHRKCLYCGEPDFDGGAF